MKLFILILVYLTNFSKQSVQIQINELKENYPEFVKYLLNQSNQTSTPSSKSQTIELIFNSTNRLSITNAKTPASTSTVAQKQSTRFLYYNNETNSFEGVSMQSTYSILNLAKNKTLTLITTSTSLNTPPPSTSTATTTNVIISTPKIIEKITKSILPLYPQFIYTIKIVNLEDKHDLINLLNDQSAESSKLRFNMVKTLSLQLGLNQSELKLNWIDKLNKINKTTLTSNSDYLNNLYQSESGGSSYNYLNDYAQSSGELEPEFVTESQERQSSSEGEVSNKIDDQTILISFSSSNLYDMQRMFLENLKQLSGKISEIKRVRYEKSLNELKFKFELECEKFFKQVIKKHETLKFRFKFTLLKVGENNTFTQTLEEFLKKVQFLKLCDLNKIYNLFKNKQYEDANTYVKNSTQEIVFNAVKLTDDYDTSVESDSILDDSPGYDEQDEEVDDYGYNPHSNLVDEVNKAEKKLVKLKSEKLSPNKTNEAVEINNTMPIVETIRAWFWKLVPEEDFLLAVIVPITIVVALFVLSIVVACLLHMFNKDYKQRTIKDQASKKNTSNTHNISLSNTTESTNSGGGGICTDKTNTSTYSKSHSIHSKSNPIYKQRAYLSKGVPVILYEEMSDKPLEDYDENNVDSISGVRVGNYYRSPYIMRFEKPPLPAPPEYSRESLFLTKKKQSIQNDESVLNELRTMLTRDLDNDDNLNGSDANKSSSSVSPANCMDSDDNVHLLLTNNTSKQQPPPPSIQSLAVLKELSNNRRNLVNEIFQANAARLKSQINELEANKHLQLLEQQQQLQKLLP